MKYKKKFIIVGHQGAISYKNIFKLFKDNKMWLGCGFKGGAAHFITKYKDIVVAGEHKDGMVRVSGVNWFTNLNINKRHENLTLYKKYTTEEYPKYDNYNAININKTKEIPLDYNGVMGVPISFMNKFNPDQFEIIGIDRYVADNKNYGHRFTINKKETYARILIKKGYKSYK